MAISFPHYVMGWSAVTVCDCGITWVHLYNHSRFNDSFIERMNLSTLFANNTRYKMVIMQLNKANPSDTEAPFLDLDMSITNGIVSTKIYDKRDVFNFEIFNFPFLDGDVPRSPSYGAYISQLIRCARVCSHVDDFNNRNIFYF